ncbi:MAG: NAD(P)-dependent glycerol-3-phosphate dehydrogenase [Chthoniobacterales bacterium]|nr:NAD(P)-dependent glycerol-3-phosphate dehydrogenase [Chthoniobacterales bacterium]
MSSQKKIGIIGAGSWGSALAVLLAKTGKEIILWGHHPEHIKSLQQARMSALYLPGISFPTTIHPTTDLAEVATAEIIFFVVPSKFLREVATSLSQVISSQAHPVLISCTKGIEYTTGKLMSEIIEELIPQASVAVLSGPNLAVDIARGLPAAGVLGCSEKALLPWLQEIFFNTSYRAYTSDDIRGIQLGGALKNIFAIAAGVSDELGMGENARAGLVTRSLAEMTRLGVAMGGVRKTFSGLSGIGDLMATCFSSKSRNYQAGRELCHGKSSVEILNSMTMIAEGFFTARSAQQCARALQVETPIIDEVVAVLDEGKKVQEAIKELFGRRLRSEAEEL